MIKTTKSIHLEKIDEKEDILKRDKDAPLKLGTPA